MYVLPISHQFKNVIEYTKYQYNVMKMHGKQLYIVVGALAHTNCQWGCKWALSLKYAVQFNYMFITLTKTPYLVKKVALFTLIQPSDGGKVLLLKFGLGKQSR